MYKIEICFLDKDFEHDIYELIKAFYPEAEIRMTYEAEETHFCDLLFVSSKAEGSYLIRYEGEGKSGQISIKESESRRENKDHLKYALYQDVLVKLTGRTLPWGNLTGIRPVKLAMGMLDTGLTNVQTAQEMRDRYLVSPKKTALAVAIANREKDILKDIDYDKGYSLYVGIPFCPSICLYCSFSSYP